MKRLFCFVVVLSAMQALAGTARVNLPSGKYQVWYSTTDNLESLPTDPATEMSSLDVKTDSDGGYIIALDAATGNLAVKSNKPKVVFSSADFNRVGEFDVEVLKGSSPINAAELDISTGAFKVQKTIDQSRAGKAPVYGAPTGDYKVVIHYVEAGKDISNTQLFTLSAKRADAIPTFSMAVPGQADATQPVTGDSTKAPLAADTGKGATKGGSSAMPSGSEAAGKVAQLLFGLVLVGGLAYFLYWLFTKKPDAVAARLRALGAPIPGDPSQPDPVAVVPAMPTPAPQQKIILEDADPVPLIGQPAPIASPMAASAPHASDFSAGARLVAANGEDWIIQEGTSTVGREAGLAISLVDESTLSRRHAEITKSGPQLTLRDLGSTNGTFVNGRKVDPEVELHPGDSIQFGAATFSVSP